MIKSRVTPIFDPDRGDIAVLLEPRKLCANSRVVFRGMSLAVILFWVCDVSAEVRKTTYTYKKVGDLEIKLDVYRDESVDQPQPVLVWIHGGALIVGNREGVDGRLKKEFAGNGS